MDSSNAISSYVFGDEYHSHVPPTFLTLPLELRWEIYAYLLCLVDPTNFPGHGHPADPKIHPQILSVCRQIHQEAHPMLYRLNRFLAHPSLLTSFPRLRKNYSPVASVAMGSLIRRHKLRVRLDAGAGFTREDATKAFSGQDDVEIEVWQAAYRGAGRELLELFEDIRGVRVARVTGSISGFEKYAQWLESRMMAPIGAVVEPKYDGEMGDMSAVNIRWMSVI